jgi:hypothetical protein
MVLEGLVDSALLKKKKKSRILLMEDCICQKYSPVWLYAQ